MANNSKAGLFIFLAILGIGAAVLLTRRGGGKSKSPSYQYSYAKPATGEWEKVYPDRPSTIPSTAPSPRIILENEQHITLKRGPDRLIEEMTIHRKVIAND